MSNFLGTLFGVIQILPQLPQLVNNVVVEVENTLNGVQGIGGSQKMAAAEAKVNSLLQVAVQDAGVVASAATVVQPLINAAVAMFNASGLFKKSAPSA